MVLIGGAVTLSTLYRAQTIALLEQELDASLMALSRAVDYSPEGGLVADAGKLPIDPRFETQLSGRYWAIAELDETATVRQDIRPPSLWDGDLPVPLELRRAAAAQPGTTLFADATGPADERLRVAVRTILLDEAGPQALLMAAADRQASDQGAQQFLILLLGAMIFLAGGVLLAMVVQVRVALSPLERVQRDVAAVREGGRQRLDEDYPAEVRPLTEELNKLLDHNRDVVERARTHVGNLAHALKTPLAVLRNEAQGDTALDDVVRRQTGAMTANVEHYLKRAQAAARAQTLGARTEVKPVVDGLVRLLNRLFQDSGIEVSADVRGGQIFRGEQQDLEEMVGNLIENGCKWADSTVRVRVEQTGGGTLRIHVDDDGEGLPTCERDSVLQRGVRLDETAPGTGLGLSIVNELAELYSGSLSLSESPEGGLRASLTFPRP